VEKLKPIGKSISNVEDQIVLAKSNNDTNLVKLLTKILEKLKKIKKHS